MTYAKSVPFVVKLIKLTRQDKLLWKRSDDEKHLAYETTIEGQKLRMRDRKPREESDVEPALEFVDDEGRILWSITGMSPVTELFNAIFDSMDRPPSEIDETITKILGRDER